MASPTIPTSFVPHQTSAANRASRGDFGGAFGFLAYGVFAIIIVLAVGVFFYGRILDATFSARESSLVDAEKALDPATVADLVRLENRLTSGQTLLENHVAFSNFFSVFEKYLPQNVRFTTLDVAIDPTGIAQVTGSGIAKNFNALAATTNAFTPDGRIKDVIFSKINVNQDNTVSFNFTASLDPKLIVYVPSSAVQNSAPSTSSSTIMATSTTALPAASATSTSSL